MKRVAFLISVFFLCTDLCVFSQVTQPDQPVISGINDNIDFESFNYRARILIHGKSAPAEVNIILSSETLIFPDNRKVKIKDIAKINVILWEKRSKLNRYTFFPSQYEIFYRDYRKEILNGNLELLNKIRTGNKKSGYIYLFYYDYFQNGRWINSGIPEFNALFTKPAEGCAVSIELIQ